MGKNDIHLQFIIAFFFFPPPHQLSEPYKSKCIIRAAMGLLDTQPFNDYQLCGKIKLNLKKGQKF